MRRVVYSPSAGRLIYLDSHATPEFWDSHWQAEGAPAPSREDAFVARLTTRHLQARARVLEGGCGRGNKVKALAEAGFESVGIDFAPESVRRARSGYPGLDIREGDVRALPFPASHFDGYWSIGVVEHFWDGYDAILAEARRVLRPGGVLFLTAPWLSPYRRSKVRRRGYPRADYAEEPADFYQFALGRQEVAASLDRHGFSLLQWRGLAPEISMQEDMTSLRRAAGWLFGSRGRLPKRALRRAVTRLAAPYCGHSFLSVAKRRHDR
jgi:SAM-dependent methyltransferase